MDWKDGDTRREIDSQAHKTLWETLDRLYAFEDTLDEFPVFLCTLMAQVLNSDLADYGEYHPASKRIRGTYWTPGSNYAGRIEAHIRHMHQQPVSEIDSDFCKERALGNRNFFRWRVLREPVISGVFQARRLAPFSEHMLALRRMGGQP